MRQTHFLLATIKSLHLTRVKCQPLYIQGGSMEKNWIQHYPKGVSPTIDMTRYKNIFDIFQKSNEKFPQHVAFSNMGVDLTFNQINKMIEWTTSFFQNELKLKKGDVIALQMPNVLQYPVFLFAALKMGLVVVNTNPLYTAKEMLFQFNDSKAKAIVILENFASQLQEILPQTQIQHVVVTSLADLFPFPKSLIVNAVIKYVKKMVPSYRLPNSYKTKDVFKIGQQATSIPVEIKQTDRAFLQYTGGTTGVSKGAILNHSQIIANALQIREWMLPSLKEGEESCITALPLYHIFSLSVNCLAFLGFGCKNILITNPKDIAGFIKTLKTENFTLMTGVNTLFNALMNHADFTSIQFKNLKLSVAGAMALQAPVAHRWLKLTHSKILEGYGLTEASPVVCCNPIDGTDIVGTIGLPLPSTEVKIVDDNDQEVPIGDQGEICCRGPQVMEAYYGREDETQLVLKNGWLYTGDIGTIDANGFVRLVDRKKDMILVSGFNVYPNEVEEVIAAHPGVLEVAAIGVPSESSGEAVKVVVVKKNSSLTEKDVIDFAKKSLTNYKVPKQVEFRSELPKTNVGKILRRALRG